MTTAEIGNRPRRQGISPTGVRLVRRGAIDAGNDVMFPSTTCTKQGYLLMEAIVAMFILAVVTIPWISFLKDVSTETTIARVDRFFLTKRYFLEALSDPAIKGTTSDQRGELQVTRSPLSNGLIQIQVNLVEKGQATVSLVGVTR